MPMRAANLSIERFVWQPGAGPDLSALQRLQMHCPPPAQPMGEAWFMGAERTLFCELEGDLDALDVRRLQVPRYEITSGPGAFGPRDEWRDWYHYLLGRLIARSRERFLSALLESLVSAFIAIHPNGVHREPYVGFATGVLLTLGRSMMEPRCWNDGEIVRGSLLHRSDRCSPSNRRTEEHNCSPGSSVPTICCRGASAGPTNLRRELFRRSSGKRRTACDSRLRMPTTRVRLRSRPQCQTPRAAPLSPLSETTSRKPCSSNG